MLWRGNRESENVVDQRSIGGKTIGVGGLVLGAVVYYLMGGNPLVYVAQNVGALQNGAPVDEAKDGDRKSFAAVVLADTEDVWSSVFAERSMTYRPAKLILFRNQVDSACGSASRAVGPFYCPGDERVYLDLSFFDELSQKLGAKGEFADAYVVAHEIGHHVQKLLGWNQMARDDRSGDSEIERNRASVKTELQADCLAGVWAKRTENEKQVIEPGDIESAMSAAAAVGDDRLQQRAKGSIVPDSFTHGSSAQRTHAFQAGYTRGQLNACENLSE